MRFSAPGVALELPDALAQQGGCALEAGGILIGSGSQVQAFTLPGPLDLRTPGMFALLDPCHQEALDRSGLSYLGAWHTHPTGTPSEYSPGDLEDWLATASDVFAQQPQQPHLYYPVITGSRIRVWALDQPTLTLTELRQEVTRWTPPSPASSN